MFGQGSSVRATVLAAQASSLWSLDVLQGIHSKTAVAWSAEKPPDWVPFKLWNPLHHGADVPDVVAVGMSLC